MRFLHPSPDVGRQGSARHQPHANRNEIRTAIAGGARCCTGYVKPVEAILRAAAVLRGELRLRCSPIVNTFDNFFQPLDGESNSPPPPPRGGPGRGFPAQEIETRIRPTVMVVAPPQTKVVNKSEAKVDAVNWLKACRCLPTTWSAGGTSSTPCFSTSPYAHARIRDIDTEAAERLPGVHAVLTYKNTRRVLYTSGGQSYPESTALRPSQLG